MLRIAVLGAGRIANIHEANVAANPDVQLSVIADPWREGVDTLAAKLGCAAAYDCAEAIARDDVDAVVIGTHTDTHIDYMLRAVKLGKPVLCEKPIDLDFGKAAQAVEDVERLNGKVMLGFNRSFDPDTLQMRKAIAEGSIGEVRQVVITSRDPGLASLDNLKHSGGIFRDMTIHDFDMARFVLGEEIIEV